MAGNAPTQSAFLYQGQWTDEIDTVILKTLVRLKREESFRESIFPSYYIIEVTHDIERELGLPFEWFHILDRIHFLERRYKTFSELVELDDTYWDEDTGVLIVAADTWATRLPVCTNLLVVIMFVLYGLIFTTISLTSFVAQSTACCLLRQCRSCIRSAARLLCPRVAPQEIERTIIVLSDSFKSQGHVCDAPNRNQRQLDVGEVSSKKNDAVARRKLMFDDEGPQDMESTTKKEDRFYVPGPNGEMVLKVEKRKTGRVLPREVPPASPNLSYSCDSSSPVTWWRMPGKPPI